MQPELVCKPFIENNPVDFSEFLMITGCNVQNWEGDFSGDRVCGLLPVRQQNVNLAETAVFQCVMITSTAIPNILGVNILLNVAYP